MVAIRVAVELAFALTDEVIRRRYNSVPADFETIAAVLDGES